MICTSHDIAHMLHIARFSSPKMFAPHLWVEVYTHHRVWSAWGGGNNHLWSLTYISHPVNKYMQTTNNSWKPVGFLLEEMWGALCTFHNHSPEKEMCSIYNLHFNYPRFVLQHLPFLLSRPLTNFLQCFNPRCRRKAFFLLVWILAGPWTRPVLMGQCHWLDQILHNVFSAFQWRVWHQVTGVNHTTVTNCGSSQERRRPRAWWRGLSAWSRGGYRCRSQTRPTSWTEVDWSGQLFLLEEYFWQNFKVCWISLYNWWSWWSWPTDIVFQQKLPLSMTLITLTISLLFLSQA